MRLPIAYPYPPAEARASDRLPTGEDWLYEPKWDGFRCLAFRDGLEVELQSKAEKPLTRYFPDLVEALRALPAPRFVLDGEIVVPAEGGSSFDALLQRIHPAESRVRRLALETPARLVAFDLLAEGGRRLEGEPLRVRRAALEAFAGAHFAASAALSLSPVTADPEAARRWLGGWKGVDGVVAKRLSLPYRSGERTGMVKVKLRRTADCVVGGFRYAAAGGAVGSLLLGLYDGAGLLHHVGFTSSFGAERAVSLLPRLEALVAPPGFTGDAPGGPSRWASDRSSEWQPLLPELVVEVEYDHASEGRFRHGTKFLRWRPDKRPDQCTFEQLERPGGEGEGISP